MIDIKGNRILFCGKGGSGKSTIVSLIAHVLQDKGYKTIIVNGDSSSPEGLTRLLFPNKIEKVPTPLIEFFGGIDAVECSIKDPSVLTRVNDSTPLTQKR